MNKQFSCTTVLYYCLLGLFSVGFTGCSANNNLNSAYAYPPVGSKLVLTRTLEVLPGRAGLYIQNGKNKAGKHSRFEPFCYLRFRNVAVAARKIVADTFVVKSSRVEMRLIAGSQLPTQPVFRKVYYRLVDSTPSDILEVVSMRVYSPKNPGVYLLECGGVENSPSEVEPPTLSDIRKTLGDIMKLKIP